MRRLADRRASVKLIPYNHTEDLPFERPERGRVDAFAERPFA